MSDTEEVITEEEGERRRVRQPRQFNQVMKQAQNQMVLISVLSEQKEQVGGVRG